MRSVKGSRGIALILVLWVIALLSVMAMGLTAAQRTESTLTANALAGARFRTAADAGIAYAALNLLAPQAVDPDAAATDAEGQSVVWLPDATPHAWTFAEVPMAISVQNEGSRIDINQADADVLTALFRVLGVADDLSATLADRILDWRDTDDLKSLNGAEDPDYDAEGLPYGAKDGPFTSVEELRQVLGITPEIYRRLSQEVTVDSGNATGGRAVRLRRGASRRQRGDSGRGPDHRDRAKRTRNPGCRERARGGRSGARRPFVPNSRGASEL